MAKLDFRNIFRLNFIDFKADHQVGNNLALLLGVSDNLYRLIDIKEDFFKTAQQMQPVRRPFQIKRRSASDAVRAEIYPFAEQLRNAENPRLSFNQDIEVA